MPSLLGFLAREAARLIPGALAGAHSRPAAVFFHGVAEHVNDPITAVNHHDANTFYAAARSLKKNFDVLPLASIGEVLRDPVRHRRSVFLMSDDGYANTAEVAAEILADLRLPWTLFVSTQHIDTGEPNPMFLARLFFTHAPAGQYEIAHLGPVHLSGGFEREHLGRAVIARLKRLPLPKAREALESMLQGLYVFDLAELVARYPNEAFLTWDGLRTLHARGVEIGAHAHHHWPMHEGQSGDYLAEQALLSRARIQAEIGPCRFFAYPFGNEGDVSRAAWHAVRDAGFDYAFSTLSGTLDASLNPFLMPRYGMKPRDRHIAGIVPILRMANARLRAWQQQLGASNPAVPVPEQPSALALGQLRRSP